MRLPVQRRRDAIALLVVTVTALAGIIAWLLGDVEMGIHLSQGEDGFVYIGQVDRGSYAESQGFFAGARVVDLQRRDGVMAHQRASTYLNEGQLDQPYEYMHFVDEYVPEQQIDYLYAVSVETQGQPYVTWGSSIGRYELVSRLEFAGLLLLIGAALGVAAAGVVSRGWLGAEWSGEATVAGVAVATPLLALPLAYSGAVGAGVAGAALPIAGTLPLAWSLADRFPGATWDSRLRLAALGLATLALLVPLRALVGGYALDREQLLLAASITALPAVAVSLSGDRTAGDRLRILALGLFPAAAILTHAGERQPEIGPLMLLGAVFIGARLLPATLPARLGRRHRTDATPPRTIVDEIEEQDDPAMRTRRSTAALVVAAVAFLAVATCCDGEAVVYGALAGAIAAFALDRGLLGPAWARAAIPLGVAIAVPIMALGFTSGSADAYAARLILPAAAALPVAHLLAWRHPDPAWRRTLFGMAVALVLVAGLVLLSSSYGGPLPYGPYEIGSGSRLTVYLLLGFIALLPGLGTALGRPDDGGALPTSRLDLVAMGVTPGAAMTVLPGSSPNLVLLVVWVLALVAWRRLTIAPLLGLAQRTQRQRDLAVAAVEAERARLAADIHDDALQELSALVRRLDTAGDTEGAELARSVAERLRAITSDLRLPLLDDLGAGAALEWLVGRFRPLTDGEVRLERVDPSRPPSGVELAVFRVAQEAIANAVKHGKPPITVRYRVDEAGAVSLSVDDEGPGIEPHAPEEALRAGHLGVANMQQRAEQIGALLDIRRWPSGGTHVALEWRPQ